MNSEGSSSSRGSRVEGRWPNGRSRLGDKLSAICNLQFRLPLIGAILLAVTVSAQAEPVKLQWGSERPAAKKPAPASSSLRFVKPSVASAKHVDASIRLAAFSADAPRLASSPAAEPATRSVVVGRSEEAIDDFRAAQLPPPNANPGATKDPSGSGNPSIENGLRSPFVDNAKEPVQPNPFAMPESNANPTLPPPANNAPNTQADRNLPPTNQVEAQPADNSTGADLLNPILPSGPGHDQSPPTPTTAADEAKIRAENAKEKESCEKNWQNLRAYTVDKVSLNIAVTGTPGEDYPFECLIDDGTMHAGRCWEQTTFMWKASAMCHKPLYFEEEQLERYGHSFSPCFQPFVSGAHFFVTLPVLPYCMGVEPPCECIYALGHYRPGSCAPYMCNPVPLSLRGALFEAGAVTGTAAALP
jgi:hypothetical protein